MTNDEAIKALKWQVEYAKKIGEIHLDSNYIDFIYVEALELAIKALEERPQGKWICDDILHCKYYCSECRSDGVNIQPFCAWCGAKMKGGKNNAD